MNDPAPVPLRLSDLLASWNEAAARADVMPGWEASMASLASADLSILQPELLFIARSFSRLDPAFDRDLQETSRRIQGDRGLRAYFWHVYRRAYGDPESVDFNRWPELEEPLGARRRIFYLIAALASVPLMRRRHREMGVAEEVTRATAQDVVEKYRRSAIKRPDLPGIAPRELTWFQHHADGTVFTLGRLQYRFRPFRGDILLFRHRRDGRCIALAEDEVVFTADGYHSPGADRTAAAHSWRSRLRQTAGEVTGHPISPRGFALRQPISLSLDEWQQVLSKGDRCFEIHVPAGGGLHLQACRESMLAAIEFHERHFDQPLPRAFSCISWFLGPQLEEILPADSNIVQFQQNGYLFPVCSTGRDGFHFLFGQPDLPPRHELPDTSLCRSIYRFVQRGGTWRSGGFLILREDVEHFGRATYRDRAGIAELCPLRPTGPDAAPCERRGPGFSHH